MFRVRVLEGSSIVTMLSTYVRNCSKTETEQRVQTCEHSSKDCEMARVKPISVSQS